jgi:hypothetical protein
LIIAQNAEGLGSIEESWIGSLNVRSWSVGRRNLEIGRMNPLGMAKGTILKKFKGAGVISKRKDFSDFFSVKTRSAGR